MFIVGITGGIGCGKTAATDYLAKKGITIVDADIVARQVVEPGEPSLAAIAEHFGTEILTSSGELDRASLRAKVFSDNEARLWLEKLLHPVIRERIVQQLTQSNGLYAVLSSPLLLETDQKLLTDHMVVIDLPPALQISRTMHRDNNSEEQVKAIIAAQMPRAQKLKEADTVVSNDSDLQSLHDKIEALHQKLSNLAQSNKIKTS